ncbi:PREDICTED: uncharacterized protein LOC104763322 [Camelina sativa]|uniref:Uncharacterized protein LOC104763322 n=1 Tax=Camelina sativa TaxID=90675 RepID=A0ABM0XF33_CAMSA|nr:PREDICTED: uncharacterized protein LOC104763322 [Camelina sativa]
MSSPDLDDEYDEIFDENFDRLFQNCLDDYGNDQETTSSRQPRAFIERGREEGHTLLWNDYFREKATYSHASFRRRFRMNKSLFIRIVDALSNEVPYFQQRRDATGRLSLSALQKCTAAIRILAYGCAADAVDEYLRLAVFDDIIEGRAPRVDYFVNGRHYNIAYYLTDGIYPRWATFIQSISLPQDPKASLFAQCQESCRKDVERTFGVLQARFAIVKNPALFLDKAKIGKIMRACIILHNMIVEDERDGYSLYNIAIFYRGEGSGTSHVDLAYSTEKITDLNNVMTAWNQVRDTVIHRRLKADLVEHIWQKFATTQD